MYKIIPYLVIFGAKMTDQMPVSKFKGVKPWLARASVGAPQLYADAELLRLAVLEYFEWIEENPLTSEKVGFSYGSAVVHEVKHPRAMTKGGLAMFLGILPDTLQDWKKTREDLKPVIEWAERCIWNQKFEAAGAGLLKESIICRELGLADKQIHAVSAPGFTIAPPGGEQPEEPAIHGET